MALRMPRPFAHKTGVFFLNVRIPQDLLGKLRRTRVTLPVGDMLVTISVSDKVFLSLQTKDPNLARTRFAAAYSALVRHWEAVRTGPKPLTHKQLVALAGEAYRHRVDAIENDPEHGPHVLAQRKLMEAEAVRSWRLGDDGDAIGVAEAEAQNLMAEEAIGEIDEKMAHFFTALQRPFGPQLIALEMGRDLDTPYAKVTYADALEDLFGDDADRLIATHALVFDTTTRARLLREIGVAMNLVGTKVLANAEGDYSVDDSRRFPAFAEPNVAPLSPAPTPGRKSIADLITKWTSYSADKKASSTIRRYGPSLRSFAQFQKGVDVRLLTSDDVRRWAEYRRDHDGIAPRTVNRNDLVAVMTLLAFATTHEGGKLRVDNPARGIKLDKPKKMESVDKIFSEEEAGAILRLARSARPLRIYPRASASRRWVPFLCAYTGARVQECCWLRKEDVSQRDGIWVVHFPQTKEGVRRWVTLHDALLDEGFLVFWRKAPDGPLFTGDKPLKADASRTPAELRASELTAWIRQNVALDPGISPSHGWRHTFISNAEDAGISKRMANAITGHNRKKDASDGYYTPKTTVMKKALDTYPRYSV